MSKTQMIQTRDMNGNVVTSLGARAFSVNNFFFTLTADTVKTVTVPATLRGDLFIACFTYSDVTADVWVLPASTPTLALPSGTVTATLAELRPSQRLVVPGQVIQMRYGATNPTGGAVSVGISFLQAPSNSTAGQQ